MTSIFFLFLFLMSSMEDKGYFLLLLSSSMEEKRWLLKNPSSSMEDEYSFYIFLFLPWKKMFSVKISFVFHGRRTFLLHFLSSSMEDERSFLFSANPMLQRRSFSCFFSMGLISNAYRAERSTNFLIMKSASMVRRPRETLNFATPRLEFYKYYSECYTWWGRPYLQKSTDSSFVKKIKRIARYI